MVVVHLVQRIIGAYQEVVLATQPVQLAHLVAVRVADLAIQLLAVLAAMVEMVLLEVVEAMPLVLVLLLKLAAMVVVD